LRELSLDKIAAWVKGDGLYFLCGAQRKLRLDRLSSWISVSFWLRREEI
jgi:hypothetical protein